jgi:hypothetical protein
VLAVIFEGGTAAEVEVDTRTDAVALGASS